MSRVGKKPIPLPKGVKVTVDKNVMNVEGPKGKQTVPVPAGITIKQESGERAGTQAVAGNQVERPGRVCTQQP